MTNAWGLAAGAGSPLWVSDNNSSDATVYSGGINGSAVKLDLTVPVPGGNATGQVANTDASAFPVGGSSGSPADFIVATDSIGSQQSPGEIAACAPAAGAPGLGLGRPAGRCGASPRAAWRAVMPFAR